MTVNTTKNEVLDKLENKNKDIRRKLTDTDKILNKTEINNGQKIFYTHLVICFMWIIF